MDDGGEEEKMMVGCFDYHPYMKILVKKTDYYFGHISPVIPITNVCCLVGTCLCL